MSLDDNSYHRSDNADKYRQHTNFVSSTSLPSKLNTELYFDTYDIL